jgi:adenylate kinase
MIIDSVATEFGVGYEVPSVTVPEALLAELADILTLDLRLEPSALMTKAAEPVIAEVEGETSPTGTAAEEEVPNEPTVKPGFRWWCENGIAEHISTVAAEFCEWRRLKPVRLLILGPPGSNAKKLVEMLSERYGIEAAVMDDVLENVRNLDTPLGHSVKEALDHLHAEFNNPKAKGPFHMSSTLFSQVAEEAVLQKTVVRYRGVVLSGFPATMEELEGFFLEDAPPPPPPADGEEAHPPADGTLAKILKPSRAPDAVIVLRSSDEACHQRASEGERPLIEAEFKEKTARWKKEMPEEGVKMTDAFRDRGVEPLVFDADECSLADMFDQVVAHLESKGPIYNFRVPASKKDSGQKDDQSADVAPSIDEGAAQKEADNRRKKKEEEDRLEAIRKEEFVRLEKHSEPLRQYLMSFVVPTLTTGLIDVCRESPDDPVAYLADYLSIYSAQLRESRRRARKMQAEAAAAAATPAAS